MEDTFGVRIPRTRCCAAHHTPAEAFCESYFARAPVTVWIASRAFGGKTFLLSLLALTEALTLEVSVTVLGGSGQQSTRVLDAMGTHWRAPAAPVHLLDGPPGLYKTRLIWGNTITALTASQTSVRGAHPARLRLDEADEMRLPILEAAQGQTMDQGAARAQTVIASTHQHPDGTMTAVLQRAAEQGWPVYQWCWQETQEPAGWLPAAQVTRKRAEITAQMIPSGGTHGSAGRSTMPATCITTRRPSFWPRTASRRRWASVRRSGHGSRCSRRTRFSSRRYAIRSSWWRVTQPANGRTRTCSAGDMA